MDDRICLVTGANSGIGQVTALELARRGAQVVMVCRDAERGAAARDAICGATGNAQVDLLVADLSSLDDVRRLASTVRETYPRLHVLVNNAGAIYLTRRETVDGLETTFAVNYLAPFLLTNLLADRLRAGVPARVVNVSSTVHQGQPPRFSDLQSRRGYGPLRAYGRAKFALILFTYALARRWAGSGVTVNCLHPGGVATNFGQRDAPRVLRWAVRLAIARSALTPEQGAATSLYLAADPAVAGVTGRYFVDCRPVPSDPRTYDLVLQERLWTASAALAGLPDAASGS